MGALPAADDRFFLSTYGSPILARKSQGTFGVSRITGDSGTTCSEQVNLGHNELFAILPIDSDVMIHVKRGC